MLYIGVYLTAICLKAQNSWYVCVSVCARVFACVFISAQMFGVFI